MSFGDVLQLSGKQSSKARGVSGNPSGRPKSNELVVALAQGCTEEAISTLAEIMQDESKPTAARVSAATALLDRGYGKAPQSVTLSDNDTPPIDLIRLVVVHPGDVTRSVGDQYPRQVSGC